MTRSHPILRENHFYLLECHIPWKLTEASNAISTPIARVSRADKNGSNFAWLSFPLTRPLYWRHVFLPASLSLSSLISLSSSLTLSITDSTSRSYVKSHMPCMHKFPQLMAIVQKSMQCRPKEAAELSRLAVGQGASKQTAKSGRQSGAKSVRRPLANGWLIAANIEKCIAQCIVECGWRWWRHRYGKWIREFRDEATIYWIWINTGISSLFIILFVFFF